ncbi:hypothetical protein EDB81DRAFT_48180 [Dactylonectria macrodidyma]|uniref:Uncharacterized protein n=1 Tax=Dactylonectria macrodidyma TaxID=307937 RepID=A0A9P9FUW6_9HYPO|nr:hypothetical protein EDB81DRAFT_48180 [Dactylonectria macrodidyma]
MQSLFRLIDHFKVETIEPSPEPSPGLRRPQRNITQPRRYDDCEVEWSQRTVTSTQQALEPTEETKFLRQSCRFALHRLEHYMLLLDQTPVYWAAAVLHLGLMMPSSSKVGIVARPYHSVPNQAAEVSQRGWANFRTFCPAISMMIPYTMMGPASGNGRRGFLDLPSRLKARFPSGYNTTAFCC